MFDHLNASPDIKLKSIEIDDELTGRRIKKLSQPIDSEDEDASGTGSRTKDPRLE
jgi:hypothetical protein